MHIDAGDFDAQAQTVGGQLRQAFVDALHQVAAQPLTAFGGAIVAADQLRAGDQDGVQIPRRGEGHSAAGHQPIQGRQHVLALQYESVGLGHLIENPHVQLHYPGIASQQADKAVANARTEAEKLTQNATQQADRLVQVAHAQASERLANAQAQTATVASLAQVKDPGLLLRLYRERMPKILGQAGSVTTVDPKDDSRLIIQGAEQ